MISRVFASCATIIFICCGLFSILLFVGDLSIFRFLPIVDGSSYNVRSIVLIAAWLIGNIGFLYWCHSLFSEASYWIEDRLTPIWQRALKLKDPVTKLDRRTKRLDRRIKKMGLSPETIARAMMLQMRLYPMQDWNDKKYTITAANYFLNKVEQQAHFLAKRSDVYMTREQHNNIALGIAIKTFHERLESKVDNVII